MDVGEVLLFIGVCGLAVYTRNVIAYVAAFVLSVLWGFALADTDLMLGLPVLICAGYMLFAATSVIWRR